ncbi:O-antigen polymerase [Seonamhaeicola maritimus]|uniref:Oligosaccharide repeat unit polymerase n=1 Tax=Seonamhaeicola maritimus TaxID=2591822 RepID=A0A5C7GIH7_9FLAO|nr:O-antigen polymerase [Seonamhaeicola maritimus]TXG37151.1 oligosaccharide repeat unit polymerase [Seonamhaeicola maritimus]
MGFITSSLVLNYKFKAGGLLNKLEINKFVVIKTLIALILISFAFRYFDLFSNREVKLTNPTHVNRYNASNPENFSLVFMVLSVFRVLFFVPLIFYFANRINKKRLLIVCSFLFLLPFLEAYLRGSRRLIFESLGLLIVILFIFNKISLKSFKTLTTLIITIIILFGFSLSVLKSRVSENNKEFFSKIFNSQYNEFIPPKQEAIKFIQENNNILGHVYFSEIHLGQYITHGIFEMDYMLSAQPKHMYGKFNCYLFIKFFNKLGVSNIPLNSLNNPTNRITYITFFGGMFLDFGWFSIPFMFLFGVFQHKLLLLSRHSYILIPLSILLLFSNVFMLIFNFFRTQFLFSITIYVLFMGVMLIMPKSKEGNLP